MKRLGWIFFYFFATSCCLQAQTIDVVELVSKHEFAKLEDHFNAIESSFERGDTTEFALLDAFKPLYMRDDKLSADLAAWTAAFPKSYVAHVARGTYYRKLGELNRGTSVASDVPGSKMSYMEQVFVVAEGDLKTALPLARKPYLALLNLMNIARYRSDDEAADRYLTEGNKALPSNMLLRGRYLDHLKPRWGGSYEAMSAFVARCKKEGLNAADLGLLSAMISDDKGLVAQTNDHYEEAGTHYKRALADAKGANARLKKDYLVDALNACLNGIVTGPECE